MFHTKRLPDSFEELPSLIRRGNKMTGHGCVADCIVWKRQQQQQYMVKRKRWRQGTKQMNNTGTKKGGRAGRQREPRCRRRAVRKNNVFVWNNWTPEDACMKAQIIPVSNLLVCFKMKRRVDSPTPQSCSFCFIWCTFPVLLRFFVILSAVKIIWWLGFTHNTSASWAKGQKPTPP